MNNSEFSILVEKYMKTVYKTALSCCRNAFDAEDVTQETFCALYATDTRFKDDEHVRKWLIRVAVNKSRDLWRSPWKKHASLTDEGLELSAPFSEEESELRSCLEKLPQKYRIVIHLNYYEGYDSHEIADILQISEQAVRKRLSRARMKLKELM